MASIGVRIIRWSSWATVALKSSSVSACQKNLLWVHFIKTGFYSEMDLNKLLIDFIDAFFPNLSLSCWLNLKMISQLTCSQKKGSLLSATSFNCLIESERVAEKRRVCLLAGRAWNNGLLFHYDDSRYKKVFQKHIALSKTLINDGDKLL